MCQTVQAFTMAFCHWLPHFSFQNSFKLVYYIARAIFLLSCEVYFDRHEWPTIGEIITIALLLVRHFFELSVHFLVYIKTWHEPGAYSGWLQLDVLMHAKRRKVHADDNGTIVFFTNPTSFIGII